jgi:hypothetical protein
MENCDNTLKKLFIEFPDVDWDLDSLVGNPNIDMPFMKNIKDNNLLNITNNKNLTWDYVMENLNTIDWENTKLSKHKCVTFAIYNQYRHSPILNLEILSNPNLTLDDIRTFDLTDPDVQEHLQHNPNITMEFILENQQIEWNYSNFGQNRNITLDIIRNNPDYEWNMELWSKYATMAEIEANLDLDWNSFLMSSNYNLTIDMIIAHPEIRWNWQNVSLNPVFDADIITRYPDLPWELDSALSNPAINWGELRYGDIICFSENPNITYQNIIKNLDIEWCWEAISINDFHYHPYFDSQLYHMRRKQSTFKRVLTYKDELLMTTNRQFKMDKYLEIFVSYKVFKREERKCKN